MTVIMATGDVGARREDLDTMFAGSRAALADGDIVFGQLETTISDGGAQAPNAKLAMRAPPALATALRKAGYDVMSFAGNHCLDWGYEAFEDTLAHMAKAGVAVCGAGQTVFEARSPAMIRHRDLTVALIACSSILPEGYRATESRPGCMPMRAFTVYEQVERDQPGTPARTVTYPHRDDLQDLCDVIADAGEEADIILVSIHWGLHMVEATIADYQRIVARAAVDAGAHAILGHHPHILKGVELYRGAPIFYSLGNFAIEQPHVWDPSITRTESFRHLVSLNADWDSSRVYMLPEDTRMTGIARLSVGAEGIRRIGFVPAWIDDDSVPRVLSPEDERFTRIADYLHRISASQGFDTRFRPAGPLLDISA